MIYKKNTDQCLRLPLSLSDWEAQTSRKGGRLPRFALLVSLTSIIANKTFSVTYEWTKISTRKEKSVALVVRLSCVSILPCSILQYGVSIANDDDHWPTITDPHFSLLLRVSFSLLIVTTTRLRTMADRPMKERSWRRRISH